MMGTWDREYRQKVLSVLGGHRWQAVDVHRCGVSAHRDENPVTIILSVFDAEDDVWWTDVIPAIREACNYDLEVRLQQGEYLLAMD